MIQPCKYCGKPATLKCKICGQPLCPECANWTSFKICLCIECLSILEEEED